jgi:hypothetical protein
MYVREIPAIGGFAQKGDRTAPIVFHRGPTHDLGVLSPFLGKVDARLP